MKELILQIDQMLATLEVRGGSVLVLADARKALGELYRACEAEGQETKKQMEETRK